MSRHKYTQTPMCFFCKHFDADHAEFIKQRMWNSEVTMEEKLQTPGQRCAAFGRIPYQILDGNFDHRVPYPDDGGIRFEMYTDRRTLYYGLSIYSDERIAHKTQVILANLEKRDTRTVISGYEDENDDDEIIYITYAD